MITVESYSRSKLANPSGANDVDAFSDFTRLEEHGVTRNAHGFAVQSQSDRKFGVRDHTTLPINANRARLLATNGALQIDARRKLCYAAGRDLDQCPGLRVSPIASLALVS